MLRFKTHCLAKPEQRLQGQISVSEVNYAFKSVIKIAQRKSFPVEIDSLKKNNIGTNSKLLMLHPFLDEEGILRLGGRLRNSLFTYDKRHPILLSSTHQLSKLLFRDEHARLLHAGPQLLLATIRDKFWPIAGRGLERENSSKLRSMLSL